MDHMGLADQVSITVDDQEILYPDSEIDSSEIDSYSSNSEQFGVFTKNGMTKIEEENAEHEFVKKSFLKGMGLLGKNTNVVAIHKNSNSSLTGKARKETFRIFSEAVARKSGGDANIRNAWFGASRDEICEIITHGFSELRRSENGESYGFGVYLSPENFSSDGISLSDIDENGLRHMLLCRVILGNMEVVYPGSKQFKPSSKQFDSGVDNLLSPRRHIIWSPCMNSHIFPTYIVSFTVPSNTRKSLTLFGKPKSPYMKFAIMLSMLSNFLPHSRMALIYKYHSEYRENKISRIRMIQKLRQQAGDKLLIDIIKFYRNKQIEAGRARQLQKI